MDVGQFRLVGGELSHSADRAKQLLALYHSGLYANQLLLRLRKSHGSRGHVLHAGVFVGVLRHQVHPVWRFAWLVVVVLRAHGIVVVENLFLSWSGCMGRVDIGGPLHGAREDPLCEADPVMYDHEQRRASNYGRYCNPDDSDVSIHVSSLNSPIQRR